MKTSLLALLFCSFALGACGGDDDDDPGLDSSVVDAAGDTSAPGDTSAATFACGATTCESQPGGTQYCQLDGAVGTCKRLPSGCSVGGGTCSCGDIDLMGCTCEQSDNADITVTCS